MPTLLNITVPGGFHDYLELTGFDFGPGVTKRREDKNRGYSVKVTVPSESRGKLYWELRAATANCIGSAHNGSTTKRMVGSARVFSKRLDDMRARGAFGNVAAIQPV